MNIRPTRAFRSFGIINRRNPFARMLVILVTAAIALVLGTGPGMADDLSPGAPTPTGTSTPAASPSATATPDPSPSTTPPESPASSPSTDAATQTIAPSSPAAPSTGVTSSVATGSGTSGTRPPRKTLAASFSSVVSAALASQCDPQHSPVLVGLFEIDGNTCVDDPTKQDWDTTGMHVDDGAKDSTAYTQGDSESTDPAGWHTGGSSQGKDDITDAWSYTNIVAGDVWTLFAVHRVDNNGTTTYDVELNQNTNSAPQRPSRSPGDLLLQFAVNGTGPLTFDQAYSWTATTAFTDPGCFQSGSTGFGWCPLNTVAPPLFFSRTSTDGLFAEGAINLSGLGRANGGICTGSFGQMNIRTVASESHTAALQDYVLPFNTNIAPTCGSIVINKFDGGNTPVGGAHFTISPDPTPGSTSTTPVTLIDGGTGDADHTANGVITISPAQAGDYTVVETQAPTGYLMPTTTSIQLTLAPGADQTATFNFHDPKQWQALTATKTAVPTYTASYDWSIVKEISKTGSAPWVADTTSGTPLTKTVPAAGNPTNDALSYRVSATEGARTTSLYKVSGNISVTNANASAVNANLSDALPGATCLVGGNAVDTVAVPSGTTAYPYVCSFAGTPAAGQLTGVNTASVTWAKADYPQVQGDVNAAGNYSVSPTAGYAFGAETTSINKTVTVTDDHHTFAPALQFTWGVGGPVHTSAVYTQSFSAAPGTCSAVLANTATLTGDNSAVLGTDSAYGKLCVAQDLGITRIDARGFTRTYPWSISKGTSTPKVLVNGGAASADYSVTVTAGDGTDSAWAMTGTITAHNPNDFESVSVTGVPISYTGGGTCSVTGVAFPVVIAAGGSQDFAYSCNFGVQPNYTGTINATVQWDQTSASTPDGSTSDGLGVTEADWTKTLVNNTVTVHDDHAAGEDHVVATLDWATVHAMPNHQDVLTYTVALQNLPDGGTCDTKTNTAWIVGDGLVHLDSDQSSANNQAMVQVCNPIGLSVDDSATGDFTRTYNWKIDKFINTDQKSQTEHIDSYDHTFDYTVIATPLPRVDSGWTVSGTIGVDNDNTDPAIAPITVTGVGELLNVGAVSNCLYNKAVPFDLSSGAHADIGFTCTVQPTPINNGGEPPVYGGTHQANVTWGTTGTATSSSANVAWNAPNEIDKSIAIYDNEVTNSANPVKLGADAVWNAAGTPTTLTYSLDLSVPQSTAGSCAPQFNNLAWLGGNGVTPTARQSSAAAIICVNAAAWTLSKASVSDPSPLMPGGTITYTLTVTHTAGVPAQNVVVVDDLSKVLNNTGGLLNVVASDGSALLVQPVGTLLAWTIPVLSSSATLTYTVQVNPDAWNTTFTNAATPQSPGGTCVGANNCSTTDHTPALPKLTLQKDVINGKGGTAVSKDWTLTATPVSIAGQSTVTGNGDPTDAGGTSDKDVLAGTYTLSESGGPAGYSQVGGWNCGPNNPVTGDQVTLALDTTVTCTVTNQQDSVWRIVKTSDPASGTVQPGQQITYTLTPTWVAGVNPTNLNITDDFSGLVGKTSAVVINDPNVTMNGNNTFTWHIATLTDQTAPLSYTVTVNADAIGVTLINLVTAPGTNCPPPVVGRHAAAAVTVTPDDCTTVHETPEWTLQKTSAPATNSSVSPGDVISYTLTVTNTSDAEVSGMHVTDDLTKVLDTATLNETPDGVIWTVVGNTLTWNVPDLAPGASAQLMYSVTLNSGPVTVVDNIAAPVEVTGHCVAAGACETVQTPNALPPVVCTTNCGHVVSPPSLPNTGGPNARLAYLGLTLLVCGGVLMLAGKRRRYQGRYRG